MFLKFYTKEESIKSKKPLEPNLEKLSFWGKIPKIPPMLLEAINQYLRFVLGGNPQWKKGFETTTFGWVWPVVSLIQSD